MAELYKQMIIDAGIPTTQTEMQTTWGQLNADEGVMIANDSAWSPFWRLISAIVTTPAMWIVNLLIDHSLPNAFLRDASGQYLDLLAWAVDVTRKPAVKTAGQLLVTKSDAAQEVTIEAGVYIVSPPIGGEVYRVVTTAQIVIPAGTLSASIPVEAERAGVAYNLGPGYFTTLLEGISGVDSVTNESGWIITAGADGETDDALRSRCRNQFTAAGQYHHDSAYRADISTFAGIKADYIWFEHGAPRGPGSANAYIMIDSGAPTQAFVDTINEHINEEGYHGHGDDMLCMPIPLDPVDLVVTVYHKASLPADKQTALQVNVENMVRFAFRENQQYTGITRTMPFSRFSFSRLANELHELLPELQSVAFSQGDITTAMGLASLSSLTVNLEVA